MTDRVYLPGINITIMLCNRLILKLPQRIRKKYSFLVVFSQILIETVLYKA